MVKFTYQSERDEDDVQVVYDSLYLRNITFGNTLATRDKLVCDYSARSDRGEGATDWHWDGALDADQLYRSAVLGKSDFTSAKVNLPQVEAPVETVEETVEEYEDEED